MPPQKKIVKGNGFVCFKNNIVKGECVLQKVNLLILQLHKSVMYFYKNFNLMCMQLDTLPFYILHFT